MTDFYRHIENNKPSSRRGSARVDTEGSEKESQDQWDTETISQVYPSLLMS